LFSIFQKRRAISYQTYRKKERIIFPFPLTSFFDGLRSLNVIRRNINIYWLLSFFYMGLIFYLSSYPVAIKVPSFFCSDKLVHIVEYGILASLIYVALKKGNVTKHHVVALAFAISFLYGVSDEIHQYFVPGRQGDIFDVMANGIGALCFPLAFQYRNNRSRARDSGKTI